MAAGLIPLFFTTGYYWRGDTQVAYFGAFYRLGEALKDGQIPLMDPSAWHGGNHVIEGYWGLLNPVSMAIAVGATYVSDAIAYMTFVKLVFLGVAAAGNFVLARSYGAPPQAAFVVGVVVPLCGFTLYLDAPTWLPGLIVSGLLPLAWWALRRSALLGRNPLPALLIGYLIVTVGYVFGTLMLAVVIGVCIVDAFLAGRTRGAIRALVIGLLTGIPAFVVHLPFVLSSAVTTRSSFEIANNGVWVTDVNSLARSALPTTGAGAPLFYITWLLPLVVLVDWRRAWRQSRDLTGLMVVWVVAVAWALGPSHLGPVRYPMRLMPYVVTCTVLLGLLCFTRARFQKPSRNRLFLALFITAFSAYLSVSLDPQHWRMQVVIGLLVGLGLAGVWTLLRGAPATVVRGWPGATAAFVALWTLVLVGVQHQYVPETFAADRGMPGEIADYKRQLPKAAGDTFIVGRVDALVEPGSGEKAPLLIGNSWYVSGRSVHNVYTPVGFEEYRRRYCISPVGATCRKALTELLSTEPRTGLLRADLMSVSSIVLVGSDVSTSARPRPPDGWQVANQTKSSVVWTRDDPLPSAGGVAWHSPELDVAEISREPHSVRLKVGDVPPAGGEIVLSRLAWPGYTVENATVVDSVDKYLLTIHVSPKDAGREVAIRYQPPQWTRLLLCLAFAVGAGLLWSVSLPVASSWRRRRRSQARPT